MIKLHNNGALKNGDPTKRQSWISIGCFTENIMQAASAFGLAAKITGENYDKGVIVLQFNKTSISKLSEQALTNMEKRVSNRSLFTTAELVANQVATLKTLAKDLPETSLVICTDTPTLKLAAELTEQAIGLALSMPQFKTELSRVFRSNTSNEKTGIPGYALNLGLFRSSIHSWRFKHLNIASSEAKLEGSRMRASAGLLFVLTDGDIAKHWFRAGRLYERAVLQLTEYGLSHSTMAAVVEAPDFHQEIEKAIKSKGRLQAIVRYGKSNKQPKASPRLSVDEILTSNA